MIQRRSITVLITVASIIAGCSKEHPSDLGPPVAKIGNEYIYLYDVISPGDSADFLRRGLEYHKNRITRHVMRAMFIKEGYKKGFHNNDSVIEKMDTFIQSEMLNIVYRKEILDRFTGEEARRKLYENLKKQVSGRHILITFKGSSSAPPETTRLKNEALNLITKIRAEINNLQDFISFADRLSEDSTSVDGGNLGFFEWGRMEDSFQEVAFSLPINTLSEPVESSYGYHLIWIDSVKSVKMASFNKMEKRLRNMISTINNESLIAAAEVLVDSLNDDAGTEINKDRIDELAKNISTFTQTPTSGTKRKNAMAFLREQIDNGPLATYYDKEITAQVLIDLLSKPAGGQPLISFTDIAFVEKIVVGRINMAIITKHGFDAGYNNAPELVKQLKKKERELVWQEIHDSEITEKMNNTDDNIRKYYDEHKDNYLSKRKSDIVEILISDKNLADSLYTLSRNGADMTELAIKFSERSTVKRTQGIIKDLKKLQMGEIGKKVSLMNVGDISEPINLGKRWSLFKVISVKEPEYKPYEKVQIKLRADFRRYEKKRITDIFESYVTDMYKPQYYYENLDNAVVEESVE